MTMQLAEWPEWLVPGPKLFPIARRLRNATPLKTHGRSFNPDMLRLHDVLNGNGGNIPDAVRQAIAEVGARGTGRHDFIVAVCGFLVVHKWPPGMIESMFLPLVNDAFRDGNWHDELVRAVEHAQSRQADKSKNSFIAKGFFKHGYERQR